MDLPCGFAVWICLARPPCPACQLAHLARCIPVVRRACAERAALNVSRLLRAEARSSQRTQDTTHDTHSDEPCPDSHAEQTRRADTRTQTRRRAPRTKQGTTARCGSVPASCATASLAPYMPWYLTVLPAPVCSICSCRGGDRPPALRSLPLACSCLDGFVAAKPWFVATNWRFVGTYPARRRS